MTSFLQFFNNRGRRANNQAKHSSPLKPRRLMTETLEERQLLAVGVLEGASAAVSDVANVINISSGSASVESIKQAIAEAATTAEDDVVKIDASLIQFDSANDEILIDYDSSAYGSITILAVNGGVTIDANFLARAFSIKNGDVILDGITIINGVADYGGAIANAGNLTLDNVSVLGNKATVSGGAIANSGALYIQDSFITDNSAFGDGAAIYEGDFSWPTANVPEWGVIPELIGSKGSTVSVDLGDYINAGNWTYSFSVADSSSVILATEPTLSSSGVLSFTFIGDDAYYGEDDYSALEVTVTATDGTNTDSTTFTVAMAEQTSTTLAAILSNMTLADAMDAYVQGSSRRPTGFSADEIPSPSVVDVTQDTTVQVWLQDFDWDGYADKIWDAGDFLIMGVQYRIHLENATVDEDAFSEASDLVRSSYVHKKLGNGDYEFIIAYTSGANFGYEEALLLDVLPIKAIDSTKPVSASIYQLSTDFTFPCYTRLYSTPTERDPSRSHINVDPSQTLFVSTISNSTEPLSSVPGKAFDTNVSRAEFDDSAYAFSNAGVSAVKSLTISNSVIVDNDASGSGVVYISGDGTAVFRNVTVAENNVADAAVYYAGSNANAVIIANTIVVNDFVSPVAGRATVSGSLFNASGWNGAIAYEGGLLFADASTGDYSLVYGSEAMNIGVDAAALDVTGASLTTDIAGLARTVGVVDAGAYEYQGSVPAAPTSVTISDYVESDKRPTLSWTASASDDVDWYIIYLIDGAEETVIASVDSSTTSYSEIASVVTLEDNKEYVFGVAAYNEFGTSSIATVTLSTASAPSAPTNLAFGEYNDGTATLSWAAADNATSYNIESLDSTGTWTVVASTTNLSYDVVGLNVFTTYTYRVTAVNSAGSASSDSIEITPVGAPDAPTGLKWASSYAGDGTAVLEWTPVDNARGYTVYQKVDGEWTAVGTVSRATYSFSGLLDNTTYEFSVASYAKDSDGNVYYSDATEITLTTTASPDAPTYVAWATEYSGTGDAKLIWNEVDGAYAYSIAQYIDGEWTEIKRIRATSYTLTGLDNNSEYVFGVASYSTSGSQRYYSDYASIDLNTMVAPDAPANVRFAPYAGGTTASLTWNASDGATGYIVETMNASREWTTVASTTQTRYDATVEENSFYVYRVSAYTTVGSKTLYSNTVTANLDTLVVPSGDLNLVVSGYDAATGTAELSWNELSGAGYYAIYEQVENGNWSMIEASATGASYVVSGLDINTNYSFRVVAVNAAGAGASEEVSLYTSAVPATPSDAAFGDLDANACEITITWSPVDNATGYTVEVYDLATDVWSVVDRDDDAATSYIVTNVERYTTYTYRISAYNDAGSSEPTVVSYVNTGVPESPTNLAVQFFKAAMSANLSWDLMAGADGYNVYLRTGFYTNWNKIASLSSISHFYTVQGLAKNTDYVFGVSALNSEGESELSTIELSTLFAPDAPADATFVDAGSFNGSATLTWTAVDGAEGYLIEQKSGDEWVVATVLDGDATSWSVSGLEESTVYTFRISAFNEEGYSDAVEVALSTGATSTPEAPTDFQIASYSEETHRATMTWTDNATNETGYEIQYSYDGSEWRSAAILGANVTTRVASGLTPGVTYYFRLAAFNDVGYSDWVQISYDVPAEVPAAPTNLTFSDYDASAQTLVVSWTDNSDDEIAFRVQYSLDQNQWYTTENTDPDVTSYTASGLVAGRTYYYRVAAVGLYGVSDWVSGSYTVESPVSDTPAAPSDIVFTDAEITTSGVDVTMSWNDNSDNEDRFVVQFSYDNTNWYGAGSTEANVTTRRATGLVSGRTYYFRVAAYNDAGYSDWATATYVAPSADVNPPSEIVFGEYSNGQLPMSWTDNSDNELGFVVQFSYDGVNWHRGGTTEANVTSRVATSVSPGRLYYFRVAAYNNEGYSEWVVGQYTTPTGAPVAPGAITFSNYSPANRTVDMTWVDNSGDETGFNIQYSIDGGDTWLVSGNTSADVNYRTATGLRVGTTYQFRVRSYNPYGSSGWTTGSFSVPVSENAPAAPTDFVFGEYDPNAKTLSMSWTDNATNESGFKVQYSVDGGATWYSAGTYGANVTSRTATSVSAGRSYTFRVAAYNSDGTSSWLTSEAFEASSSVNIPAAPTNVVFGDYDADAQTVVMSWIDNSSNEKGFKVEYSVDGGTTWNDSAYLSADVTSRTVTGLVAGRNYSFRVAAYNNYGYSDWAIGSYSVVNVDSTPAPADLAFTYSTTKRRITLSWSGDAASYNVQYQPTTGSEWYSLVANGTSASLTNVIYGSAYRFRVQSVADDGSLSEWTEGSYDTRTGGAIASNVETDSNAELFEEIFRDYLDDLL